MDDLIAFMRARLDEDERIAREAVENCGGSTHWAPNWERAEVVSSPEVGNGLGVFGVVRPVMEWGKPLELEHIARHDPASVLADVAAKRAIVDAYEAARTMDDGRAVLWTEGKLRRVQALRLAVQHLALPCAANPDYREEWKPS